MRAKKQKEGDTLRFIREKSVSSGSTYKDVNIFSLTTEQDTWHRKKKRKKLSNPKQVKQDWNYARQYATQLVNKNFGKGDLLLDLTYAEEPETRERAEKNVLNYVNRLKTLFKREKIPFRAFWVTGGGKERKDGKDGLTRFHHHLIISGGVSREKIEDCWNAKNDNRIKCDRVKIRAQDFGLEPRVLYMVKPAHCSDKPNAKRWHTAGIFKKPTEVRNDNKYGTREFEKLVSLIRDGKAREKIERLYKGWELLDAIQQTNPVTGLPWIRLKLKKNTS